MQFKRWEATRNGSKPSWPALSNGSLFDEDDARAAGAVRAELEAVGKPIGAYDVLLAGQARRRGATLVTSNTKEFARVPGLKWRTGVPLVAEHAKS